jgi:hypothetical protein
LKYSGSHPHPSFLTFLVYEMKVEISLEERAINNLLVQVQHFATRVSLSSVITPFFFSFSEYFSFIELIFHGGSKCHCSHFSFSFFYLLIIYVTSRIALDSLPGHSAEGKLLRGILPPAISLSCFISL